MTTPWNPTEMSLPEASQEYQRLRRNRCPSTADLVRENAVARRIRELEQIELRAQPLQIAEPLAQMREQLAALRRA